jgi:hypothetical protein
LFKGHRDKSGGLFACDYPTLGPSPGVIAANSTFADTGQFDAAVNKRIERARHIFNSILC